MLASPPMRAIRELSLASSLLLAGLALFFGGGPSDGSIAWLGAAAVLAILALLVTQGAPGGWTAVVPFALLAVWSLLGKVLPVVYDYGGPDVTRLRGPIGLWNQLALASDFALVLALALRRRLGVVLAYVALVALLLTYSRGGLATAALVVVLWLVYGDDRVESAVCLLAAAVPAALVVGI